MTTREARGVAPMETEEETIAAYLQHHPDFFERHSALLARLRLPHARGGSTISLVERQIEVLREKHAAIDVIAERPSKRSVPLCGKADKKKTPAGMGAGVEWGAGVVPQRCNVGPDQALLDYC